MTYIFTWRSFQDEIHRVFYSLIFQIDNFGESRLKKISILIKNTTKYSDLISYKEVVKMQTENWLHYLPC